MIIGGGISKEADKFIHDLPSRVHCVPAALQNQAGIVGAAMLAAEAAQLTAPHASAGAALDGARWRRSAGASRSTSAGGYLPIEHHGIIGDLHTVALVGNEGTIDWFCPERFDAPSMFGSILDCDPGAASRSGRSARSSRRSSSTSRAPPCS